MKVLIVNTTDRGGAANACLRLHENLLSEGIDSKVLLLKKSKVVPNTFSFIRSVKPKYFTQRLLLKTRSVLRELNILPKITKEQEFLNTRSKNLEIFSYPNSKFDITESPLYEEADIINLHWVANFLDYESFFKKNTKPVVWTLHDMNPFTGGEHYEEKFSGYNDKGDPIERIITEAETKEFEKILEKKREIFKRVQNLHVVALCNWMKEEIKESAIWNNFPVTIIPNGLNYRTFAPRPLVFSRELLGLPLDKRIMLFVSDSVDNNRKGFQLLLKVLEQLNNDNLVLCSVGLKMSQPLDRKNVHELGVIHDERLMSIVYSAADVFVIPSLMDNLPNTVLESSMCGTPVIGFPIGGIPDMIQDGKNGYLTEEISVSSLLFTIQKFLENPEIFVNKSVREIGVKKYSSKIQAEAYQRLFKNILFEN